MNFEAEINSLKDTLVVMAEIQRRQAEVQRMQSEAQRTQAEHAAEHQQRMQHIEQTLAEVGDKLNALIDVVDGVIHKPPPDPAVN
jgi:hypothetical protein